MPEIGFFTHCKITFALMKINQISIDREYLFTNDDQRTQDSSRHRSCSRLPLRFHLIKMHPRA